VSASGWIVLDAADFTVTERSVGDGYGDGSGDGSGDGYGYG